MQVLSKESGKKMAFHVDKNRICHEKRECGNVHRGCRGVIGLFYRQID